MRDYALTTYTNQEQTRASKRDKRVIPFLASRPPRNASKADGTSYDHSFGVLFAPLSHMPIRHVEPALDHHAITRSTTLSNVKEPTASRWYSSSIISILVVSEHNRSFALTGPDQTCRDLLREKNEGGACYLRSRGAARFTPKRFAPSRLLL